MDVDKFSDVFDDESPREHSDDESRREQQWFYYPLFLLFGIGTWLNLNGLWIELPLLIPRLPEGWALSAQLGMASNVANIGPLIIALIRCCSGKSSSYEVPSIIVIFLVGIFVPLLLSFTWWKPLLVFGVRRSIYLLFFGFCLALVNCTSSVTYLPFVNRFPSKWLNFYFAGESLSSLIPAMLGLIQGIGDEPSCQSHTNNSSILPVQTENEEKESSTRFSIETYLICLSLLMICSFISFILLCKLQPKRKKRNENDNQEKTEENMKLNENENENGNGKENEKSSERKSPGVSIMYLLIIFWTSILLIGCIPSINSYSLNPYGSKTFHFVLIICQCCYPLVSFISTTFPKLFRANKSLIILCTVLGTLAFIYIFLTAFMSPCSPFVDEPFGKYLIASMWIFVYLIFYAERISIGNHLNEQSGHRGLFWYGLLTQIGALVGALFIFVLTLFDVFKERDFCLNYQC